jgi:predicted nucleic acid-binding protein
VDFEAALLPYTLVKPRKDIVSRAAALTRAHELRALDALHLATGMRLRRETPPGATFHFASADRRLSVAAALEAFDVFDPRSRFRPAPAAPSRRPE